MDKQEQESNLKTSSPGEINWEFDDKANYQRDKKWYIIAGIIALALIVYSLIDKNYFFALIIIIASALFVFYDNEPPKKINITIQYDGVEVDGKFFSFDGISNFYLVYRPKENIKKLFFEFKNPLRHRLSINLENQNPILIRNFLLRYLKEDLSKEHEPLSEGLSKILKL